MARKLTQTPRVFKTSLIKRMLVLLGAMGVTALMQGCSDSAWNNPYRAGEAAGPVFFSAFSDRPKHLDPARSYSADEWAFISQVYEPPLQYHFLIRPYALTTLTAESMPEIRYFDANGDRLANDVPASEVAYTDYILRIQPGILYQPHPALATSEGGDFVYWPLADEVLRRVNTLADFEQTGTRELVAADYVYQIKRLAYRPNHSPVAGLMSEHIRGFAEFGERAAEAKKRLDENQLWLDLRDISMSGEQVPAVQVLVGNELLRPYALGGGTFL